MLIISDISSSSCTRSKAHWLSLESPFFSFFTKILKNMKSQDFEQDLYCNLFFTVKIFKPKFLAKASSLAFSVEFFVTETVQNRCNLKIYDLNFLFKLNDFNGYFYGFNCNKRVIIIIIFFIL